MTKPWIEKDAPASVYIAFMVLAAILIALGAVLVIKGVTLLVASNDPRTIARLLIGATAIICAIRLLVYKIFKR